MTKDGTVEKVFENNINTVYGTTILQFGFSKNKSILYYDAMADNEEEAIRITNIKRLNILANDLWSSM